MSRRYSYRNFASVGIVLSNKKRMVEPFFEFLLERPEAAEVYDPISSIESPTFELDSEG
jgi:hypothetical protein